MHAVSILPMSFDWEDWWQLCLPGFQDANCFEDRLTIATEEALGLCEDLKIKATWFCLADQGRRHPELIRRIASAGHEIALHGWDHTRACDMERPTFLRWLQNGKASLEDLVGAAVVGFRAPEWSLRGTAEFFWQELPELGFRYDASRAPLPVLGSPRWQRRVHQLAPGFWELPPPVVGWGVCSVPLWGWALRTLPEPWISIQLHRLARQRSGTPLVVHPWELDEGQPRLPGGIPGSYQFVHGAGLNGFGSRLRRLLASFHLVRLSEFLDLLNPEAEAFPEEVSQ